MPAIGLDVGERRIGVAVADPSGTFAMPVTTIERTATAADIASIVELARSYDADEIVVGDPITLAGERGPAATKMDAFVVTLSRSFSGAIHRVDERPYDCASIENADCRRRLAKAAQTRRRPDGGCANFGNVLATQTTDRRLIRRIAIVSAALLCIAVAAVCGWFWYASFRDRAAPKRDTRVVIERGATFSEIARQLRDQGVIANLLPFRALARMSGREVDVRAGAYLFPAHETQDDVLHALQTGGAQIAAWVTVPEGFTAEQIAGRLQSSGIGQRDAFDRTFMAQSLVVYGVRTRNLEGFLFPSTYLVGLGATPQQVVSQLTGQFWAELPRDAAAAARRLGVNVVQAVTVASLVEREAKADADRPLIAGVIYNRLRVKMPLQVDATIEYALPRHKTELSFSDLKLNSPFNTYLHPGLPADAHR